MSQLTVYTNAKQALAEYKSVDEVKDYRDKAVAVEIYAKQAQDYELEYDASLARVRAERKCGELLGEMNLKDATKNNLNNVSESLDTTPTKTLTDMGITKDQSSKWQQLAKIPDKEFEEAVNVEGAKPSTNHILKKKDGTRDKINAIPKIVMNSWGILIQMEREGLLDSSLSESYEGMTQAMQADTDRLIIKLREWVNEYEK